MRKKILLSFVGTNDAGALINQNEGAVITALKNEKFDEAYLIYNNAVTGGISYKEISERLKKIVKKEKLAKKTVAVELKLRDVTDHNEIFINLKKYTDSLPKSEEITYTAAISSGTPAMQVCWILLAESGDFSEHYPLRLIKVKDPRFGNSENSEVKLSTSLPKILRLKAENDTLIKDLIPVGSIYKSKACLVIGNTEIRLSPIELSYYYYFMERNICGLDKEKFTGYKTPDTFLESILKLHTQLFPDLESNRMELQNIYKKGFGLSIYTFRGNISKINKKIRTAIGNDTIIKMFEVSSEGGRGAKFYGIQALKDKLQIVP